MSIKIIAAIGKNFELGRDNSMMWDLPGDMKFFRTATAGSTVVMGRKTYESIGRPLPKRRNLVISRNSELKIEGCEVYPSLRSAVAAADYDCFIIGGAEIYRQALDFADELILTEINKDYPDADVYFPNFDAQLYYRELLGENSDDGVSYKHVSYKKRPCEEILSIDVKINSFEGVETVGRDGEKLFANMIGFTGRTEGSYFTGETVGTGVDTQRLGGSGFSLSARYMLKGFDYAGAPCKIFIENNGSSMGSCIPTIITDSEALKDWNNAILRSRVLPAEGGVTVKIYMYS